jgi:serine protease SohB
VFGENSDTARTKFQEQLEHTHALFKNFVAANRPQLDLSQVATGEHWYGSHALALKLVDEIKTGDDYLLDRAQTHDVFELRYRLRRNLREQLVGNLGRAARLWRGPAGML